jgi:hypothetical protein
VCEREREREREKRERERESLNTGERESTDCRAGYFEAEIFLFYRVDSNPWLCRVNNRKNKEEMAFI